MPAEIVTETRRSDAQRAETSPAPKCNLSKEDVERCLDDLTSYMELIQPAFKREEQSKHSQIYVRGLLGQATRKNAEQIARGLGENVRSLQYFVGQSQWAQEPVLAVHTHLAVVQVSEIGGRNLG